MINIYIETNEDKKELFKTIRPEADWYKFIQYTQIVTTLFDKFYKFREKTSLWKNLQFKNIKDDLNTCMNTLHWLSQLFRIFLHK